MTPNRQILFEGLLEEIEDLFPGRFEGLKATTGVRELEFSEVDFCKLLDALNTAFQIELSTYAANQCRTLEDLVELVYLAPLKA